MAVTSQKRGRKIHFEMHRGWFDSETGEAVADGPCASCGRPPMMVELPDDEGQLRAFGIDACIAPLVTALNLAGMTTTASCCGHGLIPGTIGLTDGRVLIIGDWERCREQWVQGPPDGEKALLVYPHRSKQQP